MIIGASKTMNHEVILIVFSTITTIIFWVYYFNIFAYPFQVFISGMNVYQMQLVNTIYQANFVQFSVIDTFFSIMPNFLFWIIGVPGCIYLMKYYYKNKIGFAFSFATLTILIFLSALIITGKDIDNVRYYYLLSFFFCIFAAIFVMLIFKSTKKFLVKIAIMAIIFCICFISITHPSANITNPVFTLVGGPQTFPFESELSMLSSLRLIESKPLASDFTIFYCEDMLGKSDITDISANIKNLDFSDTEDNTIIISDSIFKLTIGSNINYPKKDLIINSLAANRFSKFFDVGRAGSYIYT
jgi:hypothetical protein